MGVPRSGARPFPGNPGALWFWRATRLGSGLGMTHTSRWPWPTWRKVKVGKFLLSLDIFSGLGDIHSDFSRWES